MNKLEDITEQLDLVESTFDYDAEIECHVECRKGGIYELVLRSVEADVEITLFSGTIDGLDGYVKGFVKGAFIARRGAQ